MRAIASHLAAHGGIALIVDYGHERSAPGDTVQAVRAHRYASVLEQPGEQDLTAHVDFEAVARIAGEAGAAVTPLVTQGDWLRALGIEARADSLARTNPDRAAEISATLQRLTAPQAMGDLFKVIALHAPAWAAPAGLV